VPAAPGGHGRGVILGARLDQGPDDSIPVRRDLHPPGQHRLQLRPAEVEAFRQHGHGCAGLDSQLPQCCAEFGRDPGQSPSRHQSLAASAHPITQPVVASSRRDRIALAAQFATMRAARAARSSGSVRSGQPEARVLSAAPQPRFGVSGTYSTFSMSKPAVEIGTEATQGDVVIEVGACNTTCSSYTEYELLITYTGGSGGCAIPAPTAAASRRTLAPAIIPC
jgi:hypothetical protein